MRGLPTGTTPFELALLAAVLSLRNGSQRTPEHCLADAQTLVNAAQEVAKGRFPDALARALDFKKYTFRQLLKPFGPSKRKKGYTTLVGEITTRQGLVSAIKRAFDPNKAKRILDQRWLRESELDELNAFLKVSRDKRTRSRLNERQQIKSADKP